ncbi:MAG: adenylate kinase [Nitrososphaerota archaeon]|nr:adenylate kinase [Nitrososphaerota archaeon]
MGLRVIMVGVPGVGKSTIVSKVVSSIGGARLVNFGTIMLEVGKARRLIRDRDEIRKLPVVKQRQLQKVAASRIARMKDRVVVVDTHLFIKTPEGFWPGLPFEVVRAMNPTHLVLVEATSEEILMRRMSDASRYRDATTIESLAEELSLAKSFLAASSTLTGAPVNFVRNSQGRADEAAMKLVKVLEAASR